MSWVTLLVVWSGCVAAQDAPRALTFAEALGAAELPERRDEPPLDTQTAREALDRVDRVAICRESWCHAALPHYRLDMKLEQNRLEVSDVSYGVSKAQFSREGSMSDYRVVALDVTERVVSEVTVSFTSPYLHSAATVNVPAPGEVDRIEVRTYDDQARLTIHEPQLRAARAVFWRPYQEPRGIVR